MSASCCVTKLSLFQVKTFNYILTHKDLDVDKNAASPGVDPKPTTKYTKLDTNTSQNCPTSFKTNRKAATITLWFERKKQVLEYCTTILQTQPSYNIVLMMLQQIMINNSSLIIFTRKFSVNSTQILHSEWSLGLF